MSLSLDTLALATSDLWCIAPGHAANANAAAARPLSRGSTGGTVAIVEVVGTLTKSPMVAMRNNINQLAFDDSVGEILLLVDSPGGTVAGVHDLYTTIARAAERKPVTAIVEDMCCSGALYAVAGATEIVIGETALMGSIGVFNVVIDQSKLLERIGIEVIVIRSGEHKGAGFSGAKLTPEQLTELKRRIDTQARHFVAAVSRGRRMSIDKASALADGRVFIGREAIAAGLADRVGMYEDVLSEAYKRARHFEINNLRGAKAVKKFNELVEVQLKENYGNKYATRCHLKEQYPNLYVEAEKHGAVDKLRESPI